MQLSILKFLLIGWLGLFSLPLQATEDLSSNFKVLIMGDSLSAAYRIAIERSWPTLFESKLKQHNPDHQVFNASISGETTVGGLKRLPDLLAQQQPTHMILELGGNDGLRGFKFNQTRNNLSAMIDLAQQQQVKVLLIGVRLPPNLGPVYNMRFQQMYAEVAETSKVAYLEKFLQGVAASDPDLMQQDGIHPTELAQPILADRVHESFNRAFLQ